MKKAAGSLGSELRLEIGKAFAKERAGQAFGEVGRVIKDLRTRYTEKLAKKYQRGDVVARALSGFTDLALAAILDEAVPKSLRSSISVFAVGGYGRGFLCPYSDIDILVIHRGLGDETLKPIIEKALYPLWDAGFDVAQLIHTPASSDALAKEDLNFETTLLDARLLFGSSKIENDLDRRIKRRLGRRQKKFIAAKLAEQEDRHSLSDQSRFLAEPNLKEGKGALRDLHSIDWIHYAYTGKRLRDGESELLNRAEAKSIIRAERFLLSLRIALHLEKGRADEKLSFDIQPAVAERLDYADRKNMTPTERMMKHYFLTAMEIGRITRIFIARIEDKNASLSERAPKLLPKVLTHDEVGEKPNLKVKTNRLDFKDHAKAAEDPADFFRLFRAFSKKPGFDFHPEALAVISDNIKLVTTEVREDDDIARLFMASLTNGRDPRKLLRVMSETGLLGKYLPFFGRLTGQIEYGLYRRFTIDEHVFHSLDVLHRLLTRKLRDTHPITTEIAIGFKDRAVLFLVVLMQEARWGTKAKTINAAARVVVRATKRLGLSSDQANLVSWVSARGHRMAEVAERRSIGDPKVIAAFAEEVSSRERLDLLLILSVCHMRAISKNAWDEWTRRQLTTLYYGASAWLEGGDDALEVWFDTRRKAVTAGLQKDLADWPTKSRKNFEAMISPQLAASVTIETIVRIAELSSSMADAQENEGVSAKKVGTLVEVVVIADDRGGLLSALAGAVSTTGGTVRSVLAKDFAEGKVADIFTIQSLDGDANANFVTRLHAAMLNAAKDLTSGKPQLSKRIGDRRSLFEIATSVSVHLDASDTCLVVEAEGRDRPGLLFKLASELASIGVIIKSAHVATYGAKAVDTFYLQDAPGYKITNSRRIHSIQGRLLSVLNER